jgi:hypothetical protein
MFIKRENGSTDMQLALFIFLLGGSVASLYVGIRYKRWLLCMLSTILFMVLDFAGFQIEIVSGGVALVFREQIVIWAAIAGTIIAGIFTFIGAVNTARDRMSQGVSR